MKFWWLGRCRRFGDHLDGMAGALLEAHRAAGAEIVVVAVALAWPQLDHRVFGASAKAAVALVAVAAGQTASSLVQRFFLAQTFHYFLETALATLDVQMALRALGGVGVVPDMQLVEGRQIVLARLDVGFAAQPGVDICLLYTSRCV